MAEETDILSMLGGGDRRSTGRASEVVALVLDDPTLFGQLMAGLTSADPLVRMRAAHAVEIVTVNRPDLLPPHKGYVLGPVAAVNQQEVRWHVAQLIPRFELTDAERAAATSMLEGFLSDKSGIVRVFALQALADLAARDPGLKTRLLPLVERLALAGTPAERSRCRQLLRQLAPSAAPVRARAR